MKFTIFLDESLAHLLSPVSNEKGKRKEKAKKKEKKKKKRKRKRK